MNSLVNLLAKFFKCHYKSNRPLLLAFSGGPDSLALLYLLLEYQKRSPSLTFALAHVDHGWRLESPQEALEIQEKACELDVKLHLKVLQPELLTGNLEAACRRERIKFFAELCQEYDYEAVLFAHHADDLAETSFKRILEGVSLPYLFGMKAVTPMEQLCVWRPLLTVRKKNLIEYIRSLGMEGFYDKTNEDSRFLRARLRTKIFPFIRDEFGKDATMPLCKLSADATELCDYLDDHIKPYLANQSVEEFGVLLDLSQHCPQATIELRHLIKRYCSSYGLMLSRAGLDTAVELVNAKSANKQIKMGNRSLFIDRSRLWILH